MAKQIQFDANATSYMAAANAVITSNKAIQASFKLLNKSVLDYNIQQQKTTDQGRATGSTMARQLMQRATAQERVSRAYREQVAIIERIISTQKISHIAAER